MLRSASISRFEEISVDFLRKIRSLIHRKNWDTVKEFGHRVAANLVAKMQEVNEQKHLTKVVPTEAQVQAMIDQAKELPGVVTY